MGRITGVSAAETRERLLRAGATAFEEQGFEGTRVADIAAGAGVSNGALYSHFASKTALLAEALRDHGPDELAALFLDDPGRSVIDLLVAVGEGLDGHPRQVGGLVVEALVAARRDADVAAVTGGHLRERDSWLTDLIRQGQAEGAVDASLSPEVVSRFCMMLRLGSVLLPAAGLPALHHDEWRALIARLGDALRPPAGTDDTTTTPATTTPTTPGGDAMRVHVDQEICQGHGRCYSLAPELFEPDDIGNGVEIGDGTVAPGQEDAARKAVLNCPERAIAIEEDA